MTLSMRLLMVAGGGGHGGGGGGGAAPPVVEEPAFSSQAIGPNDGSGWGDLHPQQAIAHYHNGRTYFAYNKSNGNTGVRYYDHSAEDWSDETDLGFIEADWGHASPNLLVRDSDKRIIVVYSAHNGTALYQRISVNPADITSFGGATDLASQIGAGHFTYPQIHQLRSLAGAPLVLTFRNEAKGAFSKSASEWAYATATDSGGEPSWSAMAVHWKITNEYSYVLSSKTSETRLDFVASDGAHGVTTNDNLWHYYYDGTNFRTTDGTQMTGAPFDTSDATRLYDGSSGNEGVIPNGVSFGGGLLASVWRRYVTFSDPQDLRYGWSKWTGSAWQSQEIAANGLDVSWGNIAIDPESSSRFWMGRKIGSLVEMTRWTSDDDGGSWTEEQYPTSGTNNIHVVPVREGVSPIRAMWLGATGPIGGE